MKKTESMQDPRPEEDHSETHLERSDLDRTGELHVLGKNTLENKAVTFCVVGEGGLL